MNLMMSCAVALRFFSMRDIHVINDPAGKTGKRSGFALWLCGVCNQNVTGAYISLLFSEENTNIYFVKISLAPTINYVARISYKLEIQVSQSCKEFHHRNGT